MANETITNEMLYEFLKDMKADTNRRFEEMSTDTNRRFDEMSAENNRRFTWLEEQIRLQGQKLERIYDERDRVRMEFTQKWAIASFGIATFAAILVLAVEKAF